MKINHIASGSSGNAILVDDGHSQLLLDAGISYSKLARQVKLSKVAAVLITHEHLDHCKAVPELVRRGFRVYMSEGTCRELCGNERLPSGRKRMGMNPLQVGITELEAGKEFEIASWKVLPFDVIHDAAEPMGFFFHSTMSGKRGVYIADSGLIEYDFKGVTHWILEANYIEEKLAAGDYPEVVKRRIRRNHFSLKSLKIFLGTAKKKGLLRQTEEIWLVHLSDGNSDEQRFKDEIQRLTGVPVYTASDANDVQQEATASSVSLD